MLADIAVDICLSAAEPEAAKKYRISVVSSAQSTIAQSVLLIAHSAAKRPAADAFASPELAPGIIYCRSTATTRF